MLCKPLSPAANSHDNFGTGICSVNKSLDKSWIMLAICIQRNDNFTAQLCCFFKAGIQCCVVATISFMRYNNGPSLLGQFCSVIS